MPHQTGRPHDPQSFTLEDELDPYFHDRAYPFASEQEVDAAARRKAEGVPGRAAAGTRMFERSRGETDWISDLLRGETGGPARTAPRTRFASTIAAPIGRTLVLAVDSAHASGHSEIGALLGAPMVYDRLEAGRIVEATRLRHLGPDETYLGAFEIDRLSRGFPVEAMATANMIVYDEAGDTQDAQTASWRRAHIAAAVRDLAPGTPLIARLVYERRFSLVDISAFGADDRASVDYYNRFRVNAIGPLVEALKIVHGVRSSALSSITNFSQAPSLGLERTPNCAAIANLGLLPTLFSIADSSAGQLTRLLEFKERRIEGPVDISTILKDGQWIGSGKYAPIPANPSLGRARLVTLGSLGLVETAGDRLSVSAKGRLFMEIIGRRAFDPDIFSRWVRPGTKLVEKKHGPAIDRWMVRYFTEMRRSVDAYRGRKGI